MDTLTFGTPILLRHLTFSEAKKTPVSEITLSDVLKGMEMDMNQVRTDSNHSLTTSSDNQALPSVYRPLPSHGL